MNYLTYLKHTLDYDFQDQRDLELELEVDDVHEQCICGEYNCSESYIHWSQGY